MADVLPVTQRDAAQDAFHDALLDDDPVELYERAPCGYLSTTPKGRITKANATFLTWTGYTAEELVGKRSFVDLLTTGGKIYHETHYAPMLRMHGSVREIAVEVRRRDGERLPVLVNATLDKDADGMPRVVRIAVFDATERRGYERELVRAKEAAEAAEERARSLARTLQQTLIPPTPPGIPGLDVAAAYRPAGEGDEVGGDFYDVFPVGVDDWVMVLGDVCGKGVDAAIVTALARYTVRALSVSLEEPSEVLARLNDVVRNHETERFCTVCLIRLQHDEQGWYAVLSLGGHPSPLLRRGTAAPEPCGDAGPLVGVLPAPVFTSRTVRLEPGDVMVLYTDGVTEGRHRGEFFGDERLLESVARPATGASEVVERLVDEVVEFQAGLPRDDIAVLAVGVPAGRGSGQETGTGSASSAQTILPCPRTDF